MEQLFPEPSESSVGPRKRGETMVQFLRRSTRDAAHQCRQLLNSWLEPLHADTDLLQRMVGDDQSFRGAFLETYLNASFRQAGVDFERAPALTGPSGLPENPDFVVHPADGPCYFEATVTSPSSADQGAQRRLAQLLDKIDQMESPNFYLAMQVHTIGLRNVASAPVIRLLKAWLDPLDPDEQRSFDDLPVYAFIADDWHITFEAIAKGPAHRGGPGRTIGSQFFDVEPITDDEPLMKVLKGKAKYRALNAPYVVAVDEDSWEVSGDGIEDMAWHRTNTLYGAEAVITGGPYMGRTTRQPNGFWLRGNSYQNTRISAVLFTDHLSPHNALTKVPELWLNPQAAHTSIPRLPLWRVVKFGWLDGEEQHYVFEPAKSAEEFWTSPTAS